MKTPAKSTNSSPKEMGTPEKKAATHPKKPNNDPDQTPEREVHGTPKAKSSKAPYQGNKIGFKK